MVYYEQQRKRDRLPLSEALVEEINPTIFVFLSFSRLLIVHGPQSLAIDLPAQLYSMQLKLVEGKDDN